MAESSVSVGRVEGIDLNSNEGQREQAFKEFMAGNPFGAPPRQDQIGMTSQNPDEFLLRPDPPSLDQQIASAERQLNDLMAPIAPDPSIANEVAEWKKKYGDRENEFGTLRREKQELEETLTLLLQQQQAPQPQQSFTQGYNQQGYQPQPMPNEDPFEGIGDDDVLQGGQVKKLVARFIAPALNASWQNAEAARRELVQVRQQSFQATKQAAGITPLDELRLKSKFPALATMADGPEKVSIMRTLIGPKEQPTQPTAPVVTTAPQVPSIVRRVTHIEGSTGAAGEPNTNPNASFQAEMMAAERLPFHLRSQAMEKVLNAYKVPTVNTFGVGRYKV